MARSPRSERNPLRRRLAALRRRLRFVVTLRAVGWLLTVLLLTAAAAGFLDWAWRLPALVRAGVLVGCLAGAGIIAFRSLLRPLWTRADDLTLALRIEERYPSLNDALASTVQFLEQAEQRRTSEEGRPVAVVSPAMRLEAVRRALNKAEGCDFNRVVDSRGLRTASVSGLVATGLATALLILFPTLALTALVRLTDPFGAHDYPRATLLELDPHKSRIGRNEAFEVSGSVRGVIPEKAHVIYQLEGGSRVEHECRVIKDKEGKSGRLTTLFRPGQLQRTFSFQVRANDAVSDWHRVEVAPAPSLTGLKVRLEFPAYTDLPAQKLPDNAGSITNAVAGTVVTLRATTNTPLRAAWLEYLPEPPSAATSALLLPLGTIDPATASTAAAVAQEVGGRHPATLGQDEKSFSLRFVPRVSGMYALHFEDETGLANHRTYELRVRADRSPEVTLERPSPLREKLEVLPVATLPLRALAEDPDFFLRSAWLEYRAGPAERYRRVPLFSPGLAAKDVFLAPSLWPGFHAAAVQFKPKQLLLDRPLEIARFRRADGTSLREGDVLAVRVCADDFDDVTPGKPPGRSPEVEIRIVSRAALELALNRDEARVHQDLLELRQMQREALKQLTEIENRVARTRKLTPDDLADLARVEQTQQQLRERVEAPNQESTRARVERILETLKQNQVKRSAVEERMETVRDGLDRLSREELQQIEARLAEVRKQGEISEEARKERQAESLERAANRAEEQAKKLEELARDKPEAEKAKLQEEAGKLRRQGEKLRELASEMKKEAKQPMKDAQAAQAAARQRADQLEQMAQERERLGEDLQKRTPKDGAEESKAQQKLAREMKEAARPLHQEAREQAEAARSGERNELKTGLTEARRRQEEVEKTFSEMLERLERWSSTREVKGESRAILEEQRRLNQQVKDMEKDTLGKQPPELTPEERAKLDNTVAAQQRLRERTQQLLQKMNRLAEERKESDPETAEEMRQAAEQGTRGNITAGMKLAQEQLEQNQLSNAGKEQEKATAELEKLVRKLEDRRDAELDRLIRRMREAGQKLEELAQEQDRLRRKVREAEKIKDREKREEALRQLARKQKELKEQAEEMARQLSRLRAERAGESVRQAANQMDQAARALERGEAPAEKQDEALDRLDEGLDDLDVARGANEDELAREQLARVADTIKHLKERHDRLIEQSDTIRKEVLERKGWARRLQQSLGDLADSQKLLGQEATDLAERELTSAPVFARLMRQAGRAMSAAAVAMKEHQQKVKLAEAGDTSFSATIDREQKLAQRRLQQLLDALKMEDGLAMKPPGDQKPEQKPPEGQEERSRPLGDNIPPLAQLKLLRAIQAEVNQRTREFADKHPDEAKLTEEEKKELQAIQREQREVAELVEEYTRKPAAGEKKPEPVPIDEDKE